MPGTKAGVTPPLPQGGSSTQATHTAMVSAGKVLPLALLLVAAALGGAAAAEVRLDIPARLQWANTGGYCGETSVQMSALYYGAYVSQFVVRAAGGAGQGS